jgi:hypothetical protein
MTMVNVSRLCARNPKVVEQSCCSNVAVYDVDSLFVLFYDLTTLTQFSRHVKTCLVGCVLFKLCMWAPTNIMNHSRNWCIVDVLELIYAFIFVQMFTCPFLFPCNGLQYLFFLTTTYGFVFIWHAEYKCCASSNVEKEMSS